MSANYADFVTMLQTHMETDQSDSDFVAILPRIIEAAEKKIYRDLDPPGARKTQSGTALINGASTLSRPSDLVWLRNAWITSGTTRTELQIREQSFVRDIWPDPTITGTPKYIAEYDDTTYLLAPTPGSGLTISLFYTYRPAALSGSNTTTWITNFFPDLMDYAALVYVSGYQKNFGAGSDDPQAGVTWASLYNAALAQAKVEMSLGKAPGPFDHGPTAPITSATPPAG